MICTSDATEYTYLINVSINIIMDYNGHIITCYFSGTISSHHTASTLISSLEHYHLLPHNVLNSCNNLNYYTGLHLGNDSREGKIRFYESEGDDGVKVCVHKHMAW